MRRPAPKIGEQQEANEQGIREPSNGRRRAIRIKEAREKAEKEAREKAEKRQPTGPRVVRTPKVPASVATTPPPANPPFGATSEPETLTNTPSRGAKGDPRSHSISKEAEIDRGIWMTYRPPLNQGNDWCEDCCSFAGHEQR
jgi:hypothetical protein